MMVFLWVFIIFLRWFISIIIKLLFLLYKKLFLRRYDPPLAPPCRLRAVQGGVGGGSSPYCLCPYVVPLSPSAIHRAPTPIHIPPDSWETPPGI